MAQRIHLCGRTRTTITWMQMASRRGRVYSAPTRTASTQNQKRRTEQTPAPLTTLIWQPSTRSYSAKAPATQALLTVPNILQLSIQHRSRGHEIRMICCRATRTAFTTPSIVKLRHKRFLNTPTTVWIRALPMLLRSIPRNRNAPLRPQSLRIIPLHSLRIKTHRQGVFLRGEFVSAATGEVASTEHLTEMNMSMFCLSLSSFLYLLNLNYSYELCLLTQRLSVPL